MKSASIRKVLISAVFVIFSTFNIAAFADYSAGLHAYQDKDYAKAMAEFKRSAVLGHKPSQFNVGIMYLHGEGTPVDVVEAYAWLALSATDKDDKRVNVRDMVMGKMDEKQKDAAIDRMSSLFKEVNSESQKLTPVLVAEEQCKFHLKNIKRYKLDYPKSMLNEGKQTSSDVEFTIDKFGFARDYAVTVSFNKEFDKAIYKSIPHWRYETITVEGRPVEIAGAAVRIKFRIDGGEIDKEELKKYVTELRETAKKGTPDGLYTAAYIGSLLPELNIRREESARWFYESAKSGFSQAQYEIGKALFRGDGCEQDTLKGLHWLNMAAEEKSTDAQYFLGISLLGSDKIQEDKPKAIQWLTKAASGHHEKAMMRLAWILATDKDEKTRDPARALTLVNEVYKNYPDKLRSNETYAAAYAVNGNFEKAKELQTAALKEAKAIDYPVADIQARLDAYTNKQPWFE